MALGGLKLQVSSCGPRLHSLYRANGRAAAALATHLDEAPGSEGPDVLCLVRKFLVRRFGDFEVQGEDFAHVGMELTQGDYFPVQLTEETFTDALKPSPTTPSLRPSRHLCPSMDEIRARLCKLGEAGWSDTASRPDTCACLDQ